MKKRVLSSILILLILALALLVKKEIFTIIITLISCICLKELISVKNNKKEIKLINIISYISLILIICNNTFFKLKLVFIIAFTILFLLSPIAIFDNQKYNIIDAIFMIGITFFIGVSFYIMISLRNMDVFKVLYIFIIAFITDTYAYIGGSLIGKHHFSKISPNKTIEGSFIGSIMGTIGGSFYYYLIVGDINIFETILLSFLLTILSEIGDLVYNLIKRYFNKKDYSSLIPGHGGLLDRFDSIIFALLGYILIFNLF